MCLVEDLPRSLPRPAPLSLSFYTKVCPPPTPSSETTYLLSQWEHSLSFPCVTPWLPRKEGDLVISWMAGLTVS